MTKTTLACPDCDSAELQRARSAAMCRRSDPNEPEYWCRHCSKNVEANERPADPSGGGQQGLSKRLADMDADEL